MREKYIIGVPYLDAQHHSLFTGIERIRNILLDDDHDHERKRRACEEGVQFLLQHALRHFADEEAYMRSISDARYAQHKEQHDTFLKNIATLNDDIVESDYSVPAVKHLLGTLTSWLVFHTNEVDSTIGKEAAAIDPVNDAAVAMEKSVTQLIPDMFGVTPELIDSNYQAEYYGHEIFCLVDFGHSSGHLFRLLAALDEQVVLDAVNTMFSANDTQVDELGLSAIRELLSLMAIHFAQHYHNGALFHINRTLTLSEAELAQELPSTPPLCSLLFHQPTGTVSMRLWQL